jgi:transposase
VANFVLLLFYYLEEAMYYIGIDFGVKTPSHYCVINDENNEILSQGQINNREELEKLMKKYNGAKYLLETKNHWIPRFLKKHGSEVYAISGLHSNNYGRSLPGMKKTDKLDAFRLAKYCKDNHDEIKQIQYDDNDRKILIDWIFALEQEKTDLDRKLQSIINGYYSPLMTLFSAFSERALQIVIALADPNDFSWESVKKYIPIYLKRKEAAWEKARLSFSRLPRREEVLFIEKVKFYAIRLQEINKKLDELEQQAKDSIKAEEKYLMSFPRLGTVTALLILYSFDNTDDWKHSAAYIGIAPVPFESGNSEGYYK